MTDVNNVLLGNEYVIAKVSGRVKLKQKLKNLGFGFGRKIIFKDKSDYDISLRFVDNNKQVKIKTKYLQYIDVLDSNLPDLDTKLNEISKIIKLGVFQRGENRKFDVFNGEETLSFKNYNLQITNLPAVSTIYGDDYQNKKLRNSVLEALPDVFLGLVDVESLEQDLYLVSQFMDMGVKIILALRNYNPNTDRDIDFEYLSKLLGVSIINYSDIDELNLESENEKVVSSIIDYYENQDVNDRLVYPKYGREVEKLISKSISEINNKTNRNYSDSPRFIALEMIEKDFSVLKIHYPDVLPDNINSYTPRRIKKLEKLFGEHVFTVLKYAREDFVNGAISQVSQVNNDYYTSNSVDKVLMNKAFRLPLFILYMFVALFTSFFLGDIISNYLHNLPLFGNCNFEFNSELLNSLVFYAISPILWIAIKFLPYVFIMFLFIGILECTGYLNRLAFFVNKDFNTNKPVGRFFLPFILNYNGGTRGLKDQFITKTIGDKLLVLCILPFVLCPIQLPFYMLILFGLVIDFPYLIIAAFFIISLLFIYLFSIIFGQTIRKQTYSPMVLRLEPYRRLSFKFMLSYFSGLSVKFFRNMLLPLIFASIIIWSLSCPWNQDADLQGSLAYKIGNSIELITKPLEFDWKMNLGIISGLGGKEASVSALNVVSEGYGMLGLPPASIFVSISFVVFLMIYLPCLPSLFSIWKKENVLWILYTFIYSVSIAWLLAFSCIQLGKYIV